MKTALNELINQWRYEMGLNSPIAAIYKTFIKDAESFLEKEKEQIIDAYTECWSNDGGIASHKEKEAEQYYNEKYSA